MKLNTNITLALATFFLILAVGFGAYQKGANEGLREQDSKVITELRSMVQQKANSEKVLTHLLNKVTKEDSVAAQIITKEMQRLNKK